MDKQYNWLALAIGNSRLHWGYFASHNLVKTWNTPYLFSAVKSDRLPLDYLSDNLIQNNLVRLPVYLASVVPEQTKLWQNYRQLKLITLDDIKLNNLYPTMGIDRALVAWGAVEIYERSCLVIDGGTALTFTGVDRQKELIGGAILPGLRSQLISLQQKTAALPEVDLPDTLPLRWASNTDAAIASGIIYSAIASINSYINDWLKLFPSSKVIFTGGDGELLAKYLLAAYPKTRIQIEIDLTLIFKAIKLTVYNDL